MERRSEREITCGRPWPSRSASATLCGFSRELPLLWIGDGLRHFWFNWLSTKAVPFTPSLLASTMVGSPATSTLVVMATVSSDGDHGEGITRFFSAPVLASRMSI
jgi:hypothetical protein